MNDIESRTTFERWDLLICEKEKSLVRFDRGNEVNEIVLNEKKSLEIKYCSTL